MRPISRSSAPSALGGRILCARTAETGNAKTKSSVALRAWAASSRLAKARTRQAPDSTPGLIKVHPSAPGTRNILADGVISELPPGDQLRGCTGPAEDELNHARDIPRPAGADDAQNGIFER